MRYENKQLTDLELEAWQDEAHKRLGERPQPGDEVQVYDCSDWVSTNTFWSHGEPPAWKLSMVKIDREELEGLDRAGFRDLVRSKLQVVGDDFLRHWEEWQSG
jgi:hypothetical protein